jgi:hypothetical protein
MRIGELQKSTSNSNITTKPNGNIIQTISNSKQEGRMAENCQDNSDINLDSESSPAIMQTSQDDDKDIHNNALMQNRNTESNNETNNVIMTDLDAIFAK